MRTRFYLVGLIMLCSWAVKSQFEYRVQNVLCFGTSDGVIRIYPAGYVYKWSDGNTFPYDSNLVAANYNCVIYDSLGNKLDSLNMQVTQPTQLTNAINAHGPACLTDSNGSIMVVAMGGTWPYGYAITGSFISYLTDTTGIFDSLAAGGYTVLVSDANGCTVSDSITLLQDSLLCNPNTGIEEIVGVLNIALKPNPASDFVEISYELSTIVPMHFIVFDMTGKIVQELNAGYEATGSHTHALPVNKLSAGYYLVNLKSAGDNLHLPFVKL